MVERIYQAFQNGHFIECEQLDLKSAYDSVVANSLIYRMINDFGFDGNIIAWYKDFLKGRKTRVKYKKCTTKWLDSLENLPQGQTDSTILFDLMLNYIQLNDVDKMARDLAKMDEEIRNEYIEQDIVENDLEVHSDSEDEKADFIDDVNVTKGNVKIDLGIEDKKYNKHDLHREIRRKLSKRINWDDIDLKTKVINNDKKTLSVDSFQVDLKNFADDCTLEMLPMMEKCKLDKYIKYGYRLKLQHGLNQLHQCTQYQRFILSQPKCKSITFSRKKQQFHAYVYNLNGKKLELIHSHHNGPQKCKHNARLAYVNADMDPIKCNGDSDLENLDGNGNKIKRDNDNFKANNPKNPICTIQKTGKMAQKQKKSFNQLPTNLRILGVFLDPEL